MDEWMGGWMNESWSYWCCIVGCARIRITFGKGETRCVQVSIPLSSLSLIFLFVLLFLLPLHESRNSVVRVFIVVWAGEERDLSFYKSTSLWLYCPSSSSSFSSSFHRSIHISQKNIAVRVFVVVLVREECNVSIKRLFPSDFTALNFPLRPSFSHLPFTRVSSFTLPVLIVSGLGRKLQIVSSRRHSYTRKKKISHSN